MSDRVGLNVELDENDGLDPDAVARAHMRRAHFVRRGLCGQWRLDDSDRIGVARWRHGDLLRAEDLIDELVGAVDERRTPAHHERLVVCAHLPLEVACRLGARRHGVDARRRQPRHRLEYELGQLLELLDLVAVEVLFGDGRDADAVRCLLGQLVDDARGAVGRELFEDVQRLLHIQLVAVHSHC